MDELNVKATPQAWQVLLKLLDITIRTTGLEHAEACVYWSKTIQEAAQDADAAVAEAQAKAQKDAEEAAKNKEAEKSTNIVPLTIIHKDDEVRDPGAESPL